MLTKSTRLRGMPKVLRSDYISPIACLQIRPGRNDQDVRRPRHIDLALAFKLKTILVNFGARFSRNLFQIFQILKILSNDRYDTKIIYNHHNVIQNDGNCV